MLFWPLTKQCYVLVLFGKNNLSTPKKRRGGYRGKMERKKDDHWRGPSSRKSNSHPRGELLVIPYHRLPKIVGRVVVMLMLLLLLLLLIQAFSLLVVM